MLLVVSMMGEKPSCVMQEKTRTTSGQEINFTTHFEFYAPMISLWKGRSRIRVLDLLSR